MSWRSRSILLQIVGKASAGHAFASALRLHFGDGLLRAGLALSCDCAPRRDSFRVS